MALQGTIDTFELTEVVRLLAAGGKTGVLRLEGSRGAGRIWVDGGKVTGIEVDHAPRASGHAEAMFELLRFDDGAFTFASGERPERDGEPTDLEEILGDAEAQLTEWREIERVVPTTRATVTLCAELSRADVVLDRQRWRLVAAIGGGITVATLGERMDLGELPVSRAVKELVELGVVDLDASRVDVDPEPTGAMGGSTPDFGTAMPEPVIAAMPDPIDDPSPDASVPAYDDVVVAEEDVDLPDPIVMGEAESVVEPELVEDRGSARAQLDEFAAGFGLADTPFESAFDQPAPVGDDGFADFGVDSSGGGSSLLDEPLFATADGDPVGDLGGTSGGDERDPFAEVAAMAANQPGPFLGGGNDAAEVARQLSNLSPAAARAVAAAAKATTDEEREAALAAVAQEGDEPIDRELLLRFLASVKS